MYWKACILFVQSILMHWLKVVIFRCMIFDTNSRIVLCISVTYEMKSKSGAVGLHMIIWYQKEAITNSNFLEQFLSYGAATYRSVCHCCSFECSFFPYHIQCLSHVCMTDCNKFFVWQCTTVCFWQINPIRNNAVQFITPPFEDYVGLRTRELLGRIFRVQPNRLNSTLTNLVTLHSEK